MGSLPNLHELGREDNESSHLRVGAIAGIQCHCGPVHHFSHEERSKVFHRHSTHCKLTKVRSNGDGSKIVYDDFMLESNIKYPMNNNVMSSSDSSNDFNANFKIQRKRPFDGNGFSLSNSFSYQRSILENSYGSQPQFQGYRPPEKPWNQQSMRSYQELQPTSRFGSSVFESPTFQQTRSSPSSFFQQSRSSLSNAYDNSRNQNYQGTQETYNSRGNFGNNYKRFKGAPKQSNTSMTYKSTYPDLSDPSLPKELTLQFQPLFCKLCAAKLTSNAMAKLHYSSKNHDKRVRKFLVIYAEETGTPLHNRAKEGAKKVKESDPKYYRCDVCDLQLTGKLHAESHYMGKSHQMAIVGKKNPSGKGFYNEEGKWMRTTAPKTDTTGRDGIGLDFARAVKEADGQETSKSELCCKLCEVTATSVEQLNTHLSGSKHQKKVRNTEFLSGEKPTIGNGQNTAESGTSSNVKGTLESSDLSAFRTPTGFYYCQPCNLTLNSQVQFKQHLTSKKHPRKVKE